MTNQTALRFLAAIIVANSMSPAYGQPQSRSDGTESRRHAAPHSKRLMRSGHDAFGMVPETEFHLDPNSPEATGGGSPGYNERL